MRLRSGWPKDVPASTDIDVLSLIRNLSVDAAVWLRPNERELSHAAKSFSEEDLILAGFLKYKGSDSKQHDKSTWFIPIFRSYSYAWSNPILRDIELQAHLFMAFLPLRTKLVFARVDLIHGHTGKEDTGNFHLDTVNSKDKMTLRISTTYSGPGTEWLPRSAADQKLYFTDRNNMYRDLDKIYKIPLRAVVLSKCANKRNRTGFLHRSPAFYGPGLRIFNITQKEKIGEITEKELLYFLKIVHPIKIKKG